MYFKEICFLGYTKQQNYETIDEFKIYITEAEEAAKVWGGSKTCQ